MKGIIRIESAMNVTNSGNYIFKKHTDRVFPLLQVKDHYRLSKINSVCVMLVLCMISLPYCMSLPDIICR